MIKDILADITNEEINCRSVHISGPMGSGKTLLLKYLASKLFENGELVYLMALNEANKLGKNPFEDLHNSREGKSPAYLFIDEYSNITDDVISYTLLKSGLNNLVIIGTGLPDLNSSVSCFSNYYRSSSLCFEIDDFIQSPEVLGAFSSLLENGPSLNLLDSLSSIDAIKNILAELIDYSGGHAYPLVKLIEYFVKERREDCYQGISCYRHLGSNSFLNGKHFQSIINRCFPYNSTIYSAAVDVLSSGNYDNNSINILARSGFWNAQKDCFSSKLFISYILQRFHTISRQSLQPFEINDIRGLIIYAISQMTDGDFLQNLNHSDLEFRDRLENSITYKLAVIISKVAGVISPQHALPTKLRGHPPTIDLYINEKFDVYVEIIKNGSLLLEHFNRFLSGSYKNIERFILINFDFTRTSPLIPKLDPNIYNKYKDRHYTFTISNRKLWIGREEVKYRNSVPLYSSVLNKRPLSDIQHSDKGIILFSLMKLCFIILLFR